MTDLQPGALMRYRECEWVVLPSDDPNLVLLRPIGGSAREVCGVVKLLAALMANGETPYERIEPAQSPLPSPEDVQDHAAVRRLPDFAQYTAPDVMMRPDFVYEPKVCTYCDGSVHDEPAINRRAATPMRRLYPRQDLCAGAVGDW